MDNELRRHCLFITGIPAFLWIIFFRSEKLFPASGEAEEHLGPYSLRTRAVTGETYEVTLLHRGREIGTEVVELPSER